jgi:hypothetical protein
MIESREPRAESQETEGIKPETEDRRRETEDRGSCFVTFNGSGNTLQASGSLVIYCGEPHAR